jgi:hypothetical protein
LDGDFFSITVRTKGAPEGSDNILMQKPIPVKILINLNTEAQQENNLANWSSDPDS